MTANSEAPTVSVVVPFFRDYETLARAVSSASGQTYPPEEIIVVDDASGGRAGDYLKELQRRVPRLRVVRNQNNLGPASSRNRGWDEASGAYIAFLDSDDAWHPRKLEQQVQFLVDHPQTTLLGTRTRWVSTGAPRTSARLHAPASRAVGVLRQLIRNRFVLSSVILRADVPQRFKEGMRYSEDNFLWCSLISRGVSAAVLNDDLTYIFKEKYSEMGASGRFVKMQVAQMRVYLTLWKTHTISFPLFVIAEASSLARFARRMLIVASRRSARWRPGV